MFLPTWLVLFGQLMSYCLDFSMAQSLAAGLEDKDEEELSQVQRECHNIIRRYPYHRGAIISRMMTLLTRAK